MNDYDERTHQTLHLPTVATTAASDELGLLVDEMLAGYHGTRSSGPPSPVPLTTRVARPGPNRRQRPRTRRSRRPRAQAGAAGGRSTLSFAWHELSAHPLRLAAIWLAAVPVGLGVVHLAGLDQHHADPGTATRTPPAVTASPHSRPTDHHPSALRHAPLVPVPHRTRPHATHGHGTATPTGHPASHHPRPSPSHSRSHHPPPPPTPDPTDDSAPADPPPLTHDTPEASPR